jgi:hypothetical protein
VKTTVDIDEAVLREAEALARQEGKSLGSLMEEALRNMAQPHRPASLPPPTQVSGEGLDDNDPFFAALEEIRAIGRTALGKRAVELQRPFVFLLDTNIVSELVKRNPDAKVEPPV